MSSQDIDLEKQPMVSVTPVSNDTTNTTNNGKRTSSLATYQMLVGDVDAPTGNNLYREVLRKQRSVNYWFWFTAVLMYAAIAAQVILCLGIAIGAKTLKKETIAILAAVNTGVAATIGVLKGLGLPDKKSTEWLKLQRVAERIRIMTRKLMAGFEIDAEKEFVCVRGMYEQAEDEAQISATEISGAASAAGGGFKAFKK